VNLLLFEPAELEGSMESVPGTSGENASQPCLRLLPGDRRYTHLKKVLGCSPGDVLVVGEVGGRIGRAVVEQLSPDGATLGLVAFDRSPPEPAPIRLVLALPRPPMLRRLLQAVTSMGVKDIVLLGTRRVEKSFWQSSVLDAEAIERHLRLGLEQAVDTVEPRVVLRRQFRPFVEDELAARARNETVLVADPSYGADNLATHTVTAAGPSTRTLVVGPEGGFVPFELDLLAAAGAQGVGLGERILRVETAVLVLLAKLLS
jgi:RsmE family RNA methyltransferase